MKIPAFILWFKDIHTSPQKLGYCYIFLIIFFAMIYSFAADKHFPELNVSNSTSGFWNYYSKEIKSLYLSTVTITTLGYGDITPQTELGMTWCGLESLVGILIIGLFLNALSRRKSIEDEKENKKELHNAIYRQNVNFIRYYNDIILMNIQNLVVSMHKIIFKGKNINEIKFGSSEFEKKFYETLTSKIEYANMTQIFERQNTINTDYNTTIIDSYFDKVDKYSQSLRDISIYMDIYELKYMKKKILSHLAKLELYSSKNFFRQSPIESNENKNVKQRILARLISTNKITDKEALETELAPCLNLKKQLEELQLFLKPFEDFIENLETEKQTKTTK